MLSGWVDSGGRGVGSASGTAGREEASGMVRVYLIAEQRQPPVRVVAGGGKRDVGGVGGIVS